MARDHARIKTSRATDRDWLALTQGAQWTYDTILRQPRLSYCGVIDYFPGRIAKQSSDATEAKVKTDVKRLERARFVVVDHDTSELLIRSYIRHDGVLDRVNMGKACARAFLAVSSAKLRDAFLMELARLMNERPTLAGLQGFADMTPDGFAMASAMASTVPLPIASSEA